MTAPDRNTKHGCSTPSKVGGPHMTFRGPDQALQDRRQLGHWPWSSLSSSPGSPRIMIWSHRSSVER
jgi:hypothetical protein